MRTACRWWEWMCPARFCRACIWKKRIWRVEILNAADVRHAVLPAIDFSDGNMRSANFRDSNCRGASFRGATLDDADFSGADLSGADFSDATLASADLRAANLCGIEWSKIANMKGRANIVGPKNAPEGLVPW